MLSTLMLLRLEDLCMRKTTFFIFPKQARKSIFPLFPDLGGSFPLP